MKERRGPLLWELRAVFAARQAWLGFVAIAICELLFMALLRLDRVRPALLAQFTWLGYTFDDVFSGLTVAQHVVGFAMAGPGALCIALIAGGSVAGDWEHGPLRALLCRPASRLHLWAVKLTTCVVYTLALVLFASVFACGLGLALYGTGPLLVHVPATRGRWLYAFTDGLLLYSWGIACHAASMLTITCTAFALSCGRMRAATATIATIAYLFAEDALRQRDVFATVRPWFLMTYVTSWSRVFDPAPDWRWLVDVYGPLAAFDVVVLALAAAVFVRRDFTR